MNHRVTMWPSHAALRCLPERKRNLCRQKDTHVCRSPFVMENGSHQNVPQLLNGLADACDVWLNVVQRLIHPAIWMDLPITTLSQRSQMKKSPCHGFQRMEDSRNANQTLVTESRWVVEWGGRGGWGVEVIPKEPKESAGYARTLHWADALTGVAMPTFTQLHTLNRYGQLCANDINESVKKKKSHACLT